MVADSEPSGPAFVAAAVNPLAGPQGFPAPPCCHIPAGVKPRKRKEQQQVQTLPSLHRSPSEALPGRYRGVSQRAPAGEIQEQGRGRRAEEARVGIKGREVAERFNPAGLGEGWLQAGRPGSRGLPGGAGKPPGSSACSAGSRDGSALVSAGGGAGTQAVHSLEPVCSCGR